MQDETAEPYQAPVEATVVDTGPDPELAPAVDPVLEVAEVGAGIAVYDPTDEHEVMLAMDEHDVSMLLDYVQTKALRKWVYDLGSGTLGLTVHAVQDIVQRMNWTGKAKVGLLKDNGGVPVLDVKRITEDGQELWLVTAYGEDKVTDTVLPGAAMQPVRMKLRESTARAKRSRGEQIREDDTVFDTFSYTKAVQKATRNALKAFIPQEVEQTVLAMFSGEQARVARIQTVAEVKAAELPPPVQGPEADAKHARIRELYEQIKALGDGQGRQWLTPGKFHSYLVQSQGSLELLDGMIGWLEGEHERIAAAFAGGAS